jgi:glycosyltransferase involved in cell wall biosynthesis
LANGNFSGKRWCREVDLVITNSEATAKLYKEKDGIESTTIGPFVNPKSVVAEIREPKNVVAINPSLAKGAAIVAAVATKLEHRRPDITFEIVESRGNWDAILRSVQTQLNHEVRSLNNVIKTPNQTDMRLVYGRTRILLILSLWWESLPRVAIEAILNGIPCIGTDYGGTPEAIQKAGHIIQMPDECHRAPYNKLPNQEKIDEVADAVMNLSDDRSSLNQFEEAALKKKESYSLESRTQNLSRALYYSKIV